MTTDIETSISERAQHFLKVLVERYIRDGQPVGSRTLARDSGLDLSPATIRNVMADLEDLGLIRAPHTSAGRVPTVSGYRFFVDFLVTLQPVGSSQMDRLRASISSGHERKAMTEAASRALSDLTRMAGVVTIPRPNRLFFRQIEFLPLSANRVLVILVSSEGEVQNRVIETKEHFPASKLETCANFLNAHYSGLTLQQMRSKLLDEMKETRARMDIIMTRALEMVGQVLDGEESGEDVFVAGQANLLSFAELTQMDKLRQLFDSFDHKREMLHLLDRSAEADGVQIFIGEESSYEPFEECSLVTAPYDVDGEVAGVLAVVGPTRMAYDRVIPVVDVTAKLLGAVLNRR